MGWLVETRPKAKHERLNINAGLASNPRQHPLLEGAHFGEHSVGLGPLEIEIDRGDAEIAQRVDVADDVLLAAGKQAALAIRSGWRQCFAIALDPVG